MPGTTITISGDSNDSKMVLGSVNVATLNTKVGALETSMNLVETNVDTLETSMNLVETNVTQNVLDPRVVTQNLSYADYASWAPLGAGSRHLARTLNMGGANSSKISLSAVDSSLLNYTLNSDVVYAPSFYFSNSYTIPELVMLTSHPQIGLTPSQFKQFCDSEEGDALVQEIGVGLGYHMILAGDSGPQNSFYTVNPLTHVSDLSGLHGRAISPLKNFLISLGATATSSNSDTTLQYAEFVNPGIDALSVPWFEQMNHRYNLDMEGHGAYCLFIKLEIWNSLSHVQKTTIERECSIAHDAMLRSSVQQENEWKVANPTHRLFEHKTLPSDIQAAYDAHTLADLNALIDPLPSDHVARRLKTKLLEFKTADDILSSNYRIDSTQIRTQQLETSTNSLETSMNIVSSRVETLEKFLPTANWREQLRSIVPGNITDTYVPFGSPLNVYQNWHNEHNLRLTLDPELITEANRVQSVLEGETFAPNRQTYKETTTPDGVRTTAFKENNFKDSKFLEQVVNYAWGEPDVFTTVTDVTTVEQTVTLTTGDVKIYVTTPNTKTNNTCIVRCHGHYAFWSANTTTIKEYRERLASNLGSVVIGFDATPYYNAPYTFDWSTGVTLTGPLTEHTYPYQRNEAVEIFNYIHTNLATFNCNTMSLHGTSSGSETILHSLIKMKSDGTISKVSKVVLDVLSGPIHADNIANDKFMRTNYPNYLKLEAVDFKRRDEYESMLAIFDGVVDTTAEAFPLDNGYDFSGFPEITNITNKFDMYRDVAERLHNQLSTSGVNSTFILRTRALNHSGHYWYEVGDEYNKMINDQSIHLIN